MITDKDKIKVIAKIFEPNGFFPNNTELPFLIFKKALNLKHKKISDVKELLEKNHWHNIWVDSIYAYHHYHSNIHEMLVIFSGRATVEIGGDNGETFNISAGDVIFHPAGVSHKKIKASEDFKTIGAYPFPIQYDLRHGKKEEYDEAVKNISNVEPPHTDPIYGKDGKLFEYWS